VFALRSPDIVKCKVYFLGWVPGDLRYHSSGVFLSVFRGTPLDSGVVHLAGVAQMSRMRNAQGLAGSKKSITIPSAITARVLIFKEVIGIGFSVFEPLIAR